MTDEKLLKIIELFDAECSLRSRGLMTEKERAASLKNCQRKTDIYLRMLDNETLNDLVILIKAGKYDEHRKDDPAWNEAREHNSINNLAVWRKLIGAVRLSDDDCIKYLRSWSPTTILDDLRSYLIMEPIPPKHKALLRKINEIKVNNSQKHTRIETR